MALGISYHFDIYQTSTPLKMKIDTLYKKLQNDLINLEIMMDDWEARTNAKTNEYNAKINSLNKNGKTDTERN